MTSKEEVPSEIVAFTKAVHDTHIGSPAFMAFSDLYAEKYARDRLIITRAALKNQIVRESGLRCAEQRLSLIEETIRCRTSAIIGYHHARLEWIDLIQSCTSVEARLLRKDYPGLLTPEEVIDRASDKVYTIFSIHFEKETR